MNEFHDWPMFWITVVYVIATCAICFFSWRSNKMVEKQIAESKRQFEENQRLEKLPYLWCEFGEWIDREERRSIFPDLWVTVKNGEHNSISASGYSILIRNIGLSLADEIRCEAVSEEIRSEHNLPFRLLKCEEEQSVSIMINAARESSTPQLEQLKIIFYYKDLLSNQYKQELEIEIDVKIGAVSIIRYSMGSPIWIKGRNTED